MFCTYNMKKICENYLRNLKRVNKYQLFIKNKKFLKFFFNQKKLKGLIINNYFNITHTPLYTKLN